MLAACADSAPVPQGVLLVLCTENVAGEGGKQRVSKYGGGGGGAKP